MRLLIFAAVLLTCSFAVAKPVRESPPKPPAEKPAVVMLAGTSNWGEVSQAGTSIQINGHASWYAIGLVRPDGKVQLTWTLADGSRSGIGVYVIENGSDLSGRWGWCETCSVGKDGNLEGDTMPDKTYKIKPMEPEPDFK